MEINAVAAVGATGQASHEPKPSEVAAELAKKVFTPAPQLRPNIQDVVDIDRALIALRAI